MSYPTSFEDIAQRQGAARAQIQRIRLNNPRQQQAKFEIERLRLQGLSRLSRDEPTSGLAVISSSGAGKSATANLVKTDFKKNPAYDPTKKQIVHVTLSTTSSARSAIVSCLMAISDEYPKKTITEEEATKKLQIALEENGVELLIIDEVNHCAVKAQGKDVADTFKNMLTRGWVPIVFMGTQASNKMFSRNPELRRRCTFSKALLPLDAAIEEDANLFAAIAAGMDHEIVNVGILPELADLGDPDIAYALCEACQGMIGELSVTLEDAVCFAIERGRDRIGIRDLHQAVENRYLMPGLETEQGQLTHNPFEALVRKRARS